MKGTREGISTRWSELGDPLGLDAVDVHEAFTSTIGNDRRYWEYKSGQVRCFPGHYGYGHARVTYTGA